MVIDTNKFQFIEQLKMFAFRFEDVFSYVEWAKTEITKEGFLPLFCVYVKNATRRDYF